MFGECRFLGTFLFDRFWYSLSRVLIFVWSPRCRVYRHLCTEWNKLYHALDLLERDLWVWEIGCQWSSVALNWCNLREKAKRCQNEDMNQLTFCIFPTANHVDHVKILNSFMVFYDIYACQWFYYYIRFAAIQATGARLKSRGKGNSQIINKIVVNTNLNGRWWTGRRESPKSWQALG